MDLERILDTIQPFIIMFVALFAAFLTAAWVSAVIWTFRDIRARSRDIFAQILATLMVLIFFPLFPLPGLILYLILRPRETLSEIYERTLEEEALLQSIEERLACPTCNRRIEEDFLVCPSCHTRLKKGCPACGRQLHLQWNICPYCGTAQTAAKGAPLPHPHLVTMAAEPTVEAPMLSTPAPSPLPEPATESEIESEPVEEAATEIVAQIEDQPAMESDVEGESIGETAAEAEIAVEDEPPAEGEAAPETGDDTVATESD
jgi:RNA polymerase subunit RPABC4/transcription elongation factor Spt4